MAIYHFAVQVLGRGQGRTNADGTPRMKADNAVAAAAYRAGEKLRDEATGRAQDYHRRAGVAHREIIVPEGGAAWLADRERLWNTVEAMEKRRDAQLAREINMALPHQLDADTRRQMVQEFVREQFVSQGMVADFALHDPMPGRGDDPRNFHAHVMLTLRKATAKGLHPVKTREWNSRALLGDWRKAWAVHVNRALQAAGRRERVSADSLEAQRAEALARGDRKTAALLHRAPEVHVGPRPRAMEARGVEPVSRARRKGGARTARPPVQLKVTPHRLQSYEAFQRERAERRDREREAFAEERLQRARERWAKRKAWEDRQREWRFKADARAARKGRQGHGERRSRDYPRTDQGPRVSWLWAIVAGNNAKFKADQARLETRAARFSQWADHQQRKASWWQDGPRGAVTHPRWQAAKSGRDRRAVELANAAHAHKRASQLRTLLTELRQLAAMLSLRREAGLQRARQLERGWGHVRERQGVERAGPGGRGRARQGPSGHNGPSKPNG